MTSENSQVCLAAFISCSSDHLGQMLLPLSRMKPDPGGIRSVLNNCVFSGTLWGSCGSEG